MIDWMKMYTERLAKKVDNYKANNNGKETIEIPIYDFFVMLESMEDVVDEWCGSERVSEIVSPVYEKYMDLNEIDDKDTCVFYERHEDDESF